MANVCTTLHHAMQQQHKAGLDAESLLSYAFVSVAPCQTLNAPNHSCRCYLQAAIRAGVTVCLATGKARPAALAALTPVGLAGTHLHVQCILPSVHVLCC